MAVVLFELGFALEKEISFDCHAVMVCPAIGRIDHFAVAVVR